MVNVGRTVGGGGGQRRRAVVPLAAAQRPCPPTMSDNAFRKLDIDAFDEDLLHESELWEPDPRDPAQALSDARQKAAAVRSALAKCVLLPHQLVRLFILRVAAPGETSRAH